MMMERVINVPQKLIQFSQESISVHTTLQRKDCVILMLNMQESIYLTGEL